MKKLLLALLLASNAAYADIHQRCIMAGDSIQTYVYTPAGVISNASDLTSNIIPQLSNVSIANLSAAGQRMASGGYYGYGLVSNQAALWYLQGGKAADCIIITLGTNDWSAPFVGAQEFITAYRNVIRYSKVLGMKVIVVPPLWRSNEGVLVTKPDGAFTIAQFRYYAAGVGYEEGAKVFDAANIGLTPAHFADGLHLNAEGHRLFATALVDKMRGWGFWQ